jgi:hypothetical protein
VGFLHVRHGEDFAREIGFDDVLQPGQFGMVQEAAARADIGIDVPGVGRVLPPVRELVAVGIKDGVEAQRLNEVLLGTRDVQQEAGMRAKKPLCRKGRGSGE